MLISREWESGKTSNDVYIMSDELEKNLQGQVISILF